MNYYLLKSYMKKFGDDNKTLAEALGIHTQTLYMKMRELPPKQQFTQDEIAKIVKRYSLNADEVMKIFFDDFV